MSAYDELDSLQAMRADAAVAGARLPLVAPRLAFTDIYSDFPTDLPKPEIEISEAAQRIANALSLHLD
ncbi:MAG TPA: hypothetical protein VFV89_15630 [Nocardioides sp.]|uniref:hypothetical protein n=1 Tax=Nocardioides sp. TaxID=35761 RepID=UPI002E339D15|nr:hypothetical protein [Nocardioides sp.]HEX5089239.1 hypothetical protein [Nocardioides sp.]